MSKYTVITFAPVQGFIEKSRKLRDLYGASLLLSYLSQKLVSHIETSEGLTVISPGMPTIQKGMPNRILIQGELSQKAAEAILLNAWKEVLRVCRTWIEKKIPDQYHWEREWSLWGNHTWEVFRGSGDDITAAMDDLETCKLSRAWTAVNWIGESSSLTGTDAIAFPGLGAETQNPKYLNYASEKEEIKKFYSTLAKITEQGSDTPEGKFIAPNEKLSIPELVKRLVTWYEISKQINIPALENFTEIQRKPQPTEDISGQWTGWFMGDGDRVGKHLKQLARKPNGEQEIQSFSLAMRDWGKNFERNFPKDLGRVVYAGGDDFLGTIYSRNPVEPIPPIKAYEWLMTLNDQWQQHQQKITVSVGFVWVAGSVPQRDVLQHCREAEKVAKSLDRNRVTIRVVFNSGQYVQWTCPWDYLDILQKYRDRNGNTFAKWKKSSDDSTKYPNWSHIYQDLAQLESRRAFENTSIKFPVNFFDIYFRGEAQTLLNSQRRKHILGFREDKDPDEEIQATVDWISNLVKVGWQLCSNTK